MKFLALKLLEHFLRSNGVSVSDFGDKDLICMAEMIGTDDNQKDLPWLNQKEIDEIDNQIGVAWQKWLTKWVKINQGLKINIVLFLARQNWRKENVSGFVFLT